ncbi:MAG TPA: PIG-L family deacetylase [Terrimesophilobacter sp.]|uniref:PIG-L family deacetylase n=1 Tax=Terrimesophilobacter sp. TaxID=2906435 RepID=UPI002F95ED22
MAAAGSFERGLVDPSPTERILFVHAHPDDETIATGGTIATLIDAGAAVTVLTCTRGELGEVIPEELRHLEGAGQALAAYREGELAEAIDILGVVDHRFLGNPDARVAGAPPRRYLDSGMQWGRNGAEALPNPDPSSLCSAEFGEVVSDIATVIASVRPTALVSYDASGGYGHPDHVLAHEASGHAALVMRVPFFSIIRPESAGPGDLVVDVRPVLGRKTEALRAYRTQLVVEGDTITHSGGQAQPIGATEAFRPSGGSPTSGLRWDGLNLISRVFACLLAATAGAAIGFVATVNHQLTLPVFGLPVWAGLGASLAIVAAFLIGIRILFGTRVVAACAAIGLLLVVGGLSLKGPGGSVLVPANPQGWVWGYAPVVIAAVVLAWPRAGTFRRATMGRTGKAEEADSP